MLHSLAFGVADKDNLRKMASPFLLPFEASDNFHFVLPRCVRLDGREPYLTCHLRYPVLQEPKRPFITRNMLWHLI